MKHPVSSYFKFYRRKKLQLQKYIFKHLYEKKYYSDIFYSNTSNSNHLTEIKQSKTYVIHGTPTPPGYNNEEKITNSNSNFN